MTPLQILDPPNVEPVSLGEAQTFLKIEDERDAARIEALVRTSREACELFLGFALVSRTVRLRSTIMGPRFYLSSGPVQQLEGISAFQGVNETLYDPADFPVLEQNGRAYLEVPGLALGLLLQVDYTIGLGPDWNAVPEAIRQGILRLVAHQYEQRSDPHVAALPHAVTALWQPYRKLRL